MSNIIITSRRLPHWHLDGGIYFVTWNLRPDQRPLVYPERAVIAGALRHFHRERYFLLP